VQKQQGEAAGYLLRDHNLQKELEAGVENLRYRCQITSSSQLTILKKSLKKSLTVEFCSFINSHLAGKKTQEKKTQDWNRMNLIIVGIIRATGITIVSLLLLLLVGRLKLPGLMMP